MKKLLITICICLSAMNFSYATTTPIDVYVANPQTNADFEFTTGFNMQGTHQWIGEYLIKNFIGNLYGFLNGIKYWLVVLFFFGGVLYFTLRAFSFYRH